jgi:hypothetical protein
MNTEQQNERPFTGGGEGLFFVVCSLVVGLVFFVSSFVLNRMQNFSKNYFKKNYHDNVYSIQPVGR